MSNWGLLQGLGAGVTNASITLMANKFEQMKEDRLRTYQEGLISRAEGREDAQRTAQTTREDNLIKASQEREDSRIVTSTSFEGEGDARTRVSKNAKGETILSEQEDPSSSDHYATGVALLRHFENLRNNNGGILSPEEQSSYDQVVRQMTSLFTSGGKATGTGTGAPSLDELVTENLGGAKPGARAQPQTPQKTGGGLLGRAADIFGRSVDAVIGVGGHATTGGPGGGYTPPTPIRPSVDTRPAAIDTTLAEVFATPVVGNLPKLEAILLNNKASAAQKEQAKKLITLINNRKK